MEFTELTGAVVNTTDTITMAPAYQKVFVANGPNKLVVDFLNNKLVYSSGFTTPPLKGDTLTQVTTNAAGVVDYVSADKKTIYITKTTEEDFDTTHTISSDDAGGVAMSPVTFTPTSVTKPTTPHVSSWTVHPSKTVQLPDRVYLVCLYNGRLVLSGDPAAPGAWYMTRQGDPFDLDYTVNTDLQSPVSAENADFGMIGDIVKALIPFHDDYLIFGCQNSMHYIQGDPMAGGGRFALADQVGIFSDSSWCFDGDGNLWFWGTGGLYRMSVKKGVSAPELVSANVIADMVREVGADPHTHKVMMGYDAKRNGIKLMSTKLSDGSNKGYWIQIEPFGIWPEDVDTTISAYSMLEYYGSDPEHSGLLIGCQDGFVRKEETNAKSDEGTSTALPIESEVLLPVVPLGKDADSKGRLLSTTVLTSGGRSGGSNSDTDSVTLNVYRGDSLEEVVEDVRDGAAPVFSTTITGPGRQSRIRKKVTSRAIGFKLSNDQPGSSWSIEGINIDYTDSGGI